MSHRAGIYVSHNAEIAHRLMNLPGKCEHIHGHSLQIEMHIAGHIDEKGLLAGLDFGSVKKVFRTLIDEQLDHQLHLNYKDPWSRELINDHQYDPMKEVPAISWSTLPGLRTWPGDPTTENIAKWICEAMCDKFGAKFPIRIFVQETNTNGAEYQLP